MRHLLLIQTILMVACSIFITSPAGHPYRLERDGNDLRLCAVGEAEPNCLYREKR